MRVQDFIKKWQQADLKERSAAQEHFLDLCDLFNHPTPAQDDPKGERFTFEKQVMKSGGGKGFADVWKRGYFGWEYKGNHADLDAAYMQLLRYHEHLENPPLLVVSDMQRFEIHTRFVNSVPTTYTITIDQLENPTFLNRLRAVFDDPAALDPKLNPAELTAEAAGGFARLADTLRAKGHAPRPVAHFLTQSLFCFFAEDIGLLPRGQSGYGLYTEIIKSCQRDQAMHFPRYARTLFQAMATGGTAQFRDVSHFNGGLFEIDSEAFIPELGVEELGTFNTVAELDWSAVQPSIFGTLFERGLDPTKRSQLGAHYTSYEDILTLVEPVLMAPLRAEWEAVKALAGWPDNLPHPPAPSPSHGEGEKGAAPGSDYGEGEAEASDSVEGRHSSPTDRWAALKPLARAMRHDPTEAEDALWQALRNRQLDGFKFRRQHAIGPFIVDFFCPDAHLVVEVDGPIHDHQMVYDAVRQQYLEAVAGLQVLRLTNDQVLTDLPTALSLIRSPLHDHTPAPLHEMERGSQPQAGRGEVDKAALRAEMLNRLRTVRVLDPACGSGNFLYSALNLLLDLEKEVITYPGFAELPEERPGVHPRQLHGIELSQYAHELASVVVWIGYIQWHMNNGYHYSQSPFLQKLDTIECKDAILGVRLQPPAGLPHPGNDAHRASYAAPSPSHGEGEKGAVPGLDHGVREKDAVHDSDHGEGERNTVPGSSGLTPLAGAEVSAFPSHDQTPTPLQVMERGSQPQAGRGEVVKPTWPTVDVIVGNPPFLGGKLIRGELGGEYTDTLFSLYSELPNFSDLVCYWFERSRQQIEDGNANRAGLIATQSIRGGASRTVLERIKTTGEIFFAVSDREWKLDGANVQVSMVGFDDGSESQRSLNDEKVTEIYPNLTSAVDVTQAKVLPENNGIAFVGTQKSGPFDLSFEQAKEMLESPINPNGRPNSDVIKPWMNGNDLTKRSREMSIIDFTGFSLEQAAEYEKPFEYVKRNVKPLREKNKRKRHREEWWLFGETRQGLRTAVRTLTRFVVTPMVSKHRVFGWVDSTIVPENLLVAFARDDDYFFGVLHSHAHELWSLRQGSQLREKSSGNRYTPTTTFETFPFPWAPGHEPASAPPLHEMERGPGGEVDKPGGEVDEAALHHAIASAAHALNEARENWLNPERGPMQEKISYDEMLKKRTLTNLYNEYPTWLENLHRALDAAVYRAYGWDDFAALIESGNHPNDEELLRRLLALNLQRAG